MKLGSNISYEFKTKLFDDTRNEISSIDRGEISDALYWAVHRPIYWGCYHTIKEETLEFNWIRNKFRDTFKDKTFVWTTQNKTTPSLIVLSSE